MSTIAHQNKAALRRAVEAAGSQVKLAEIVGKRQSHVWDWLNTSKKGTPAEFVLKIEAATGVPRHELRADVYPAPGGPS